MIEETSATATVAELTIIYCKSAIQYMEGSNEALLSLRRKGLKGFPKLMVGSGSNTFVTYIGNGAGCELRQLMHLGSTDALFLSLE